MFSWFYFCGSIFFMTCADWTLSQKLFTRFLGLWHALQIIFFQFINFGQQKKNRRSRNGTLQFKARRHCKLGKNQQTRKLTAVKRHGTQQRPESLSVNPPGMRVNTQYINSTKGTSSKKRKETFCLKSTATSYNWLETGKRDTGTYVLPRYDHQNDKTLIWLLQQHHLLFQQL